MINLHNHSYNTYNCSYYKFSYHTIVIFILLFILSFSATSNSSPPLLLPTPQSTSLLATTTPTTSSNPYQQQSNSTSSKTLSSMNNDNRSNNNNNNNIDNNNSNLNYLNSTNNLINQQNNSSSTETTLRSITQTTDELHGFVDYKKLFNRERDKPVVCPSIQIRNNLQSFDQLRNCNIIDGSLTIALVSNRNNKPEDSNKNPYKQEDYNNLTFPNLYEITEYLLFFRVEGLSTLSKLFPNLAVIRGKQLFSNYAFIIYQMFHLQEINLPSLTDILRGGVRIENNPNLCYVTTVNWDHICKLAYEHFIKGNNKNCNNKCPNNCRPWKMKLLDQNNNADTSKKYKGQDNFRVGAKEDNGTVTFCWSHNACQQSCQENNSDLLFPFYNRNGSGKGGGCCSQNCAGGCYEPGKSDQCLTCRSVIQEDKCVENCAPTLFEYRGRCITELECMKTTAPIHKEPTDLCAKPISDTSLIKNLKPIKNPHEKFGRCQAECPTGSEENPNNRSRCIPCDKGKCRKTCTPKSTGLPKKTVFVVNNVRSLKEISGCNTINGSLEINMKGGNKCININHIIISENVLNELEKSFEDLEEITGYLKISRSYPIITLSFFKNLKSIRGSELDRNLYSIILVDNPNLQELFIYNQSDINDTEKPLTISNGKIFAHLNPKLCLHRINNLRNISTIANWDERDVSVHTNGDKEACSTEKLVIKINRIGPRWVLLDIENYAKKMTDSRSLLYYLINYREVESGNITMFDGRDGCNSQNDLWTTNEEQPTASKSEDYQQTIVRVKPATRYAIYVKTFTLFNTDTAGALSDIIYFETAPDRPSTPQELQGKGMDPRTIYLSWEAPQKPNGILKHYRVVVSKSDQLRLNNPNGICGLPLGTTKLSSSSSLDKLSNNIVSEQPDNVTNKTTPSNSDDSNNQMNSCQATNIDISGEIQEDSLSFQDQIIDMVYLKQCSTSLGKNLTKRWAGLEDESTAMTRMITNTFNNELVTHESYPSHKSLYNKNNQIYNNNIIVDNNAIISNNNPTSRTSKISYSANMIISNNNNNETIIKNNDERQQLSKQIATPQKKSTPIMLFDPTIKENEINVTADFMSVNITNLEHYTSYSIVVYACHIDYNMSNYASSKPPYVSCSIPAMTLVRTQPILANDQVTNVRVYPANETSSFHLITWEEPKHPNGPVYGYDYSYYPKGKESGTKTGDCLTQEKYKEFNGATIASLDPGSYVITVRALTALSVETSDYIWSQQYEFVIDEEFFGSASFYAILFITFVAICFTIAGFIIFQQRRAKQELKKSLVYASVNPDYIEYKPDEWEVPKESLVIGKQVGVGSFGLVYEGLLTIKDEAKRVAIKTTPAGATAKQRVDFLREASLMKKFDTHHVIKLLGVVSSTTPVYVIMEFMDNGDLKTYVRKLRQEPNHAPADKNNSPKLIPVVPGIYMMAAQIADGMAYIHSKKIVHRDLAARNCMVSKTGQVKIGDFGLTRDLNYSDYYRRDTQGRLPVKWMAPEALRDNIYNPASDVWSYGIVMWEVATFGDHPYPGVSNDELVKKVLKGYRMDRPETCPEELFYIIDKCWIFKDKDRPSFLEIMEYLWPFTDGKLYPNCYFRPKSLQPTQPAGPISDQQASSSPPKAPIAGDSIESKPSQQPVVEDNNPNGAESFPLLSWPSPQNCANGMTNGVNHVVQKNVFQNDKLSCLD